MIKPKVPFLCTGNSRRTQMAEGFLWTMAGDRFDVMSAGSEETPLDPNAVAVMREVGVDISGHQTKAVKRFLGRKVSLSRDVMRSGKGAHLPGLPVRPIYKDYPIYAAGHGPPGYMEWLKRQEPVILWDDKGHKPPLVTQEDWIKAGGMVFEASAQTDGVMNVGQTTSPDGGPRLEPQSIGMAQCRAIIT